MAGVTNAYHFDIFDKRFTGLEMSDLEPWWATACRVWLFMVKSIREARPFNKSTENVIEMYQDLLDRTLKTKHPREIYKLHEQFQAAMELEAKCSG